MRIHIDVWSFDPGEIEEAQRIAGDLLQNGCAVFPPGWALEHNWLERGSREPCVVITKHHKRTP